MQDSEVNEKIDRLLNCRANWMGDPTDVVQFLFPRIPNASLEYRIGDKEWEVLIHGYGGEIDYLGKGSTPNRAVCRAFLKFKENSNEATL